MVCSADPHWRRTPHPNNIQPSHKPVTGPAIRHIRRGNTGVSQKRGEAPGATVGGTAAVCWPAK